MVTWLYAEQSMMMSLILVGNPSSPLYQQRWPAAMLPSTGCYDILRFSFQHTYSLEHTTLLPTSLPNMWRGLDCVTRQNALVMTASFPFTKDKTHLLYQSNIRRHCRMSCNNETCKNTLWLCPNPPSSHH